MERKLFCEISPLTYKLSVRRKVLVRKYKDLVSKEKFAKFRSSEKLPVLVFEHKSLIRRVLGDVDMQLQENKATNLALAAPEIDGVMIYPGEVFSLWKLVGECNACRGYKEGVTISNSKVSSGVGGGMCQLSNLIHWMILHSPLEITERHHHDDFDLFPDFDRKVPFGIGTSIAYNYLDYRFKNTTDNIYQLCVWVSDKQLCGELRAQKAPEFSYEIRTENERFVKEDGSLYRLGKVYRKCTDKKTGRVVRDMCIQTNHAKVMYAADNLIISDN